MSTAAGDILRDELLDAARRHGEEGEPEHEVGDLEEVVLACWKRLSPAQQVEVHAEIMAEWSTR